MPEQTRGIQFWVAVLILVATVVVSVFTYDRRLDLHFRLGPELVHHWMTWVGTVFIGVFTPAYRLLKRRYRSRYSLLLNIHTYGNLVAFLLISVHFAQQIGRPAEFFPDLGTGLALYITVSLLVVTGFLQRFRLAQRVAGYQRSIHVGTTMAFYIVIVIHILQGLGVL